MININKPVQTRDGRNVRIIATDRKGDYPIVVLIEECESQILLYTKEGHHIINCKTETDLINVPEKQYLYINVYKHYKTLHNTQLEAESEDCTHVAIGKMKVEIDETRQDW